MFNTDSIAGISVDKYSAPFVYDFNQDGKTDLLVGNQLGKLAYYEDTSSTSQKKLALQTISLGGFKAGDVNDVYGYCVPFIGKMDDMNKEYLLIGNIDGTVARYDNFINNFGTFQRIDSNYSFIQMPPRSVPAVADLDGDGTYDMLIGNRMGGLCYYKQVKNVLSNTPADFIWQTPDIELYPNPAHQQVYIWNKSGVSLTDMSVQIITTCMQEVGRYEHIREGESLYLPSLSPGMYVVVIQTATATCRKKLLVVND